MIDDGRVQRENTFHADAKTDFADRYGLANTAVFSGNADAFKCLQAFLVAFLDPDMNPKRVARLKTRSAFL